MRKSLLPTQAGILTVALLIACPLLNSPTDAMSVRQAVLKNPTTADHGTRQASQTKTAVLVRNTNHESATKPEKVESASAAKSQRPDDKKTVGRCWKRLMSNLREIRNAHKKN